MFHRSFLEKRGAFVQFPVAAGWFFLLFSVSQGQAQVPESQVVPEREMREEQIAEPNPTQEADLKLTGYVDATYLYNFGPGNATSPLDFPTDTIPRGDLNLSALWLRLEKPLIKGNIPEAGLQVGLMIGEDATYYAGAGLNNPPSDPSITDCP